MKGGVTRQYKSDKEIEIVTERGNKRKAVEQERTETIKKVKEGRKEATLNRNNKDKKEEEWK